MTVTLTNSPCDEHVIWLWRVDLDPRKFIPVWSKNKTIENGQCVKANKASYFSQANEKIKNAKPVSN